MSAGMNLSSEITETSRNMGHVLGHERKLTQQPTLKAVREKSSLPQDKHKVERNCESRLNEKITEKVAQLKSSANQQKSQKDDNELVRHMSNLPGFLQRVEKESSLQEKALNFGVLDWTRLEKWKYTERMPLKYPKKASSSSASGPTPKMVPNLRKQPSLYSGKQPFPRFTSPQRQREERNPHKEEKYDDRIKSKGKETCAKEYKAAECSINQDRFHQKVKFHDRSNSETNVRKDPKKEMISEMGKHDFSHPSHKKIVVLGKKSETRLDDAEAQNIVLLVPKHFPKKSCSESSQFTESRTSIDGQLAEAAGNRLSDFFSPQEQLYSEVFSSLDIPHSCPLPSVSTEPHSSTTSQEQSEQIASDFCPNPNSVTSTTSKGKISKICEENSRPSSSLEPPKEKQAAISETKGRAPSPTRRFSFNLGKMGRSFSFKESSTFPELSSAYTAVNSANSEKVEKDHPNANNRSRSSPLRRLLDPLLKHKGTQSSEKGNLPFKAPSQGKVSSSQALLQLTLKNGLPFFKLVVENSNEMLAAGVKKLPTSGKSDSCMIYAFYSVHEIKKKGMNWMNQGSKSKSCSLGYNIVGQMKISNSSECVARECVLHGVDPGQVGKQALEFVPNKEIAAIIIENSINDGENRNPKGKIVLLPGGVHGVPIKGAPSSLISRWRTGGTCDCGGWDVGCKLKILSDNEKSDSATDHLNLFIQGGEQNSKPVFCLKPCNNGFYSIELDASISLLEAFATSVAYISCCKFPELIDSNGQSEAGTLPEAVIGTNKWKTQTPFHEQLPAKYVTCPPLSPVGRI